MNSFLLIVHIQNYANNMETLILNITNSIYLLVLQTGITNNCHTELGSAACKFGTILRRF